MALKPLGDRIVIEVLEEAEQKAQGSRKQLEAVNAALEQSVTELKKRPWWQFWG